MDHIKKFRIRRDERMKNRLDDEWKTIKGTHVLIDDEGQVSGGPDSLKSLIKNSGGFKPGTKKAAKKETAAKAKDVAAKGFGDDINKAVGDLKQSMRDKKGTLTADAKKQFSSVVKDILPKAPVGTALAFSDHGAEKGLKCVKTGDNSWTTSYTRDGKKYERETTDEDVFHTLLGHTATDWKKTKSGVTASEEAGGKKESTGKSDFFKKTSDGRSMAKSVQLDMDDARQAYWDAEQLEDIDEDVPNPKMYPRMVKAQKQFNDALSNIPDGTEFEMKAVRHRSGISEDGLDLYTFKKQGDNYVGKMTNKEWDWRNKEFSWSPQKFFAEFCNSPMYDLIMKEPKEAETMEEGFEKEGYKKNAAGRWEAASKERHIPAKSFGEEGIDFTAMDRPAFSTRSVANLMTGNVTNDLHGDWGRYMKRVPTGSSFTVKTSNRWHDEKETYTKTDTGWRFEREVDGRGMDKGNADLGRIWNSMREGRITEDIIPGRR